MDKVITNPKGKAISTQYGWRSLPERRLLPLWVARIVNFVLRIIEATAYVAMVLFLLACALVTMYVILF
jgi:hypothetical protein